MTTLLDPTAESEGVPLRVAEPEPASENDIHDGQVEHVSVMVFELGVPSSASVAVIEYEYAVSSVAEVTAVLVMLGASA
jgi:hypothetical protein